MTSRYKPHYCRCHSNRNSEHRIPTEWYCFVHRRFVCDNCVADETKSRHTNCVVGKYSDFLSAPKYEWPHKCALCTNTLPDDSLSVQRLMCKCVFHVKCLREHCINQPNNDIPCPKCGSMISNVPNKSSKLGRSVSKFLKLVTRERLFHKPMITSLESNDTITNIRNNENKNKTQNINSNLNRNSNIQNFNISQTQSKQIDSTPKTRIVVDSIKSRSKAKTNRITPNMNSMNESIPYVHKSSKYHKPKTNIVVSFFTSKWTLRKIILTLLILVAFITQLLIIYFLFIHTPTISNNSTTNDNSITKSNNNNNNIMNQALPNYGNIPLGDASKGDNKILQEMLGERRMKLNKMRLRNEQT